MIKGVGAGRHERVHSLGLETVPDRGDLDVEFRSPLLGSLDLSTSQRE